MKAEFNTESYLTIEELKFFTYCQAACLLIVTSLLSLMDFWNGNLNIVTLGWCLFIACSTTTTLFISRLINFSGRRYWLQQALFFLILSTITLLLILSLR